MPLKDNHRLENERARDRQIAFALNRLKNGRRIHTREWVDKSGQKRCYDDILLSAFFSALNCSIESISITKRMFTSWADMLFGGVDTLLASVLVNKRNGTASSLPFYFYSRTSGTAEERDTLNNTTPDDLIIRISWKPNCSEAAPQFFDPTFVGIICKQDIITIGGERLDYEKIEREIYYARARNDARIMAIRENEEANDSDDYVYELDDIDFCNIE